jgi:hypothetical protein
LAKGKLGIIKISINNESYELINWLFWKW